MFNYQSTLAAVLLLGFFMFSSCADQQKEEKLSIEQIEIMVEETLNSISPIFEEAESMSRINQEGPILVSFNLVMNTETNEMIILGFEEEPFFPIHTRESFINIAGKVYSVECNVGGTVTTTKCDDNVSCAKQVAACINRGGSASICEIAPEKLETASFIRARDIDFLTDRGISKATVEESLPRRTPPIFNFSKAPSKSGIYRSVKMEILFL